MHAYRGDVALFVEQHAHLLFAKRIGFYQEVTQTWHGVFVLHAHGQMVDRNAARVKRGAFGPTPGALRANTRSLRAVPPAPAARALKPLGGTDYLSLDMPVKTVIACGQFSPEIGDVRGNVRTMSIQARDAAHRGARVLVFPELCLSGYPTAETAAFLAVTRDGPELGRVADCARAAGIALCFGFVERSPEGVLYNSLGLMRATGELMAVYRKVHLWDTEKSWAAPGNGFFCVAIGEIPTGLWICYDTRFPEAARSVALRGATLGCAGSAWFGPAEEWELALRARAMDNGIYCAGAAMQGAVGSQALHGVSLIVDPHGTVIARARAGTDEVISADYDSDAVDAFRARLPLLSHLRPESYA